MLESKERKDLISLTRTVKTSDKLFRNAQALLLCDKGPEGPAWTVGKTAQALGVSARRIEQFKRRFVEEGLEAALHRKPQAVSFDGEFEARLIALGCLPAPEGHTRWTVRLLAAKAVELGPAPRVSPITVHRILEKQTAS